jgi:hypothetical protein
MGKLSAIELSDMMGFDSGQKDECANFVLGSL